MADVWLGKKALTINCFFNRAYGAENTDVPDEAIVGEEIFDEV